MHHCIRIPLLAFAVLALSGCIARTALDIATLPVRAAGKAVDLVTTSQSEADEKRGRDIRRREERLARLERDYLEEREKCEAGNRAACESARETYREMQALLPTVPLEPED